MPLRLSLRSRPSLPCGGPCPGPPAPSAHRTARLTGQLPDRGREPWPGGNTAQLHSLGITITGVRERVRARMPLLEEAKTLRIPGGVPVMAVTRQTYAGKRVVEVATEIVLPADRVELDYWIDLS